LRRKAVTERATAHQPRLADARNHQELVGVPALVSWAGVNLRLSRPGAGPCRLTPWSARCSASIVRRHGEARAKALLDYFDHAAATTLPEHVIINPQADRQQSVGRADDDLVARLVDEDSAGSRARRQNARHPRNHVQRDPVANLQPCARRGGSGAVVRDPGATSGLKICRELVRGGGGFAVRQPVSSQFDENDAVIWFEDVKVRGSACSFTATRI